MNHKTYESSHATKQAICAALKELMAQKPLERITVSEIMDRCGMVRQHFYYHFEDIYDLVRWMFQEEAVSLLERQEGALLWQEGLLQLFQYLQENREVCLCALHSLSRTHLKHFFHTDLYAIIGRTVSAIAGEVGCTDEDEIELLTHFSILSLAGLVESWLLGEIDKTPEELIGFVDRLLRNQLRGAALENGRTPGQEGPAQEAPARGETPAQENPARAR